jgi:hypothetical protein
VRVAAIDCIDCHHAFRGFYALPVRFRRVAIPEGGSSNVELIDVSSIKITKGDSR